MSPWRPSDHRTLTSGGQSVNYAGIKASDNWRNYVRMARELQRVDIFGLNREQKLAFFINVYNALVVHGNIATGHPTNVWQRWKVRPPRRGPRENTRAQMVLGSGRRCSDCA